MVLYVAGPLFTLAERDFNVRLATELRARLVHWSIVLPQEECAPYIREGRPWSDIYDLCLQSVDRSSCVLAILDGPDVDSGTCVEIGYARARNKRIVGIRTDSRASEDRGLNLMVANACDTLLCYDSDTELSHVVDRVIAVIAPSP